MNTLFSVDSIIDFGILKGERFYRIYRHHITYLEWLIRETDICFADLTAFYTYGKIKRFNPNLSAEKRELITQEIREDSKSRTITGKKLLTIKNLDKLINNDLLDKDDFIDVDYHFSKELFMINADKAANSRLHVSTNAIENVYSHNFFYED